MTYSSTKQEWKMNRSENKQNLKPESGKSKNLQPGQKEQKTKKIFFLVTGLVVLAIAAIVGVFYYQAYVKPFQRTIITVDETTLKMDYFLERTRMSAIDPAEMIRRLTNEVLINIGAEALGISVNTQDIDQDLRRLARGESASISEAAFKEWYRQQLNQTKASDATYREFIQNSLLATRLQAYLVQNMSTIVPQVRVSVIFVNTEGEAKKAIERWKGGEDFASLARQVSTDAATREQGGDMGWMPRGVSTFDGTAFALNVGQISEPIPHVADSSSDSNAPAAPAFYYVIMVTDKSEARQVDAQYLPSLKSQLLVNWLTQEMGQHQIKWNFNSEIYNWLNQQLAKSASSSN
jgi:foldase protein PrsA